MVSGTIALPEGAVYSEELANFYGTQIELMQSSEIRKRAAARVAVRPELRPTPVHLSVAQQRGTSFFILSASAAEPQYCQAFLNAVMAEYVQFKREMRSDSADTAVTSVTDQLLKLDKELQAGEEELIAFQKKDNVVFLEEEGNSAGKYLIQLKQNLADLKTEYELLRLLDVDQNIARQQQQQPKNDELAAGAARSAMVGGAQGPENDYLEAKQQIQILEATMERLGKVLRRKHPKMVALASQIEQQNQLIELYRNQSAAQIQTRRAGIGLQIQNVESEIMQWEGKALDLNQKIAEYNRIKAKVERSKSLSDRLLATVQSVDVNKSLGQDVLTIMEPATVPDVSSPGYAKELAIGGMTGLILGLAIVSVLALLDDRVSSVIEVQQAFEEEVMAQIPKESDPEHLDIVNARDRNPMFAEACKNLRSSLLFMPYEGQRPKTILVTSSIPGEGKSTISAGLAATLAAAGSRTLLVDADVRKGRLHGYFDDRVEPGLSEVLRREINVREAITVSTQENLFFLPRGKLAFDGSELFLREVTNEFLRQVYQDYDFIVIDTSPVLAKEDAASLAPKIDATLFVIRAGVASLRKSRSAIEMLHKRNVNVLGIIFNSASRSSPGYYYYESYGDEPEPQAKVS